MRVFFAVLIAILAAGQAQAQTQWQVRDICDLRKGGGLAERSAECAQLASEVLMLLPEKAGPGNVAVLADFTDNLEKAQVNWDAPCRDQAHCPAAAYTIRYAVVSRKIIEIPKDRIFTALVCREGFSETAPDDAACRLKLLKVVREMATRARKDGQLLAVLKCGGSDSGAGAGTGNEAIRPDGQGVAGYELVYAFVQLPDMLPMAGNDPKSAARQVASQLAGPAPDTPAVAAPAVAVTAPGPIVPLVTVPQPVATPPATMRGRVVPAVAPVVTVPAMQTVPAPVAAPAAVRSASPSGPASQPASGEVLMQVAALPNLIQAETLADRLAAKGIEASFERAEVNGREVYRVMAKGKGTATSFRQRLAEMGYPGAIERR